MTTFPSFPRRLLGISTIFSGFFMVSLSPSSVCSVMRISTRQIKTSSDAKKQKPARTVCICVLLSELHVQTFCLDDIFSQKICDIPSELQIFLEGLLICDRILYQCIFSNLLSKCFTKALKGENDIPQTGPYLKARVGRLPCHSINM